MKQNSTNLKLVNGGVVVKQGDSSSVIGYKLLDENKKEITELNGTQATVTMQAVGGKTFFEKTITVKDNAVEFTIDRVLPAKKYTVEVIANGYVFPSDRQTFIRVEKSNEEYVPVSPLAKTVTEARVKDLLAAETQKVNDLLEPYAKRSELPAPVSLEPYVTKTQAEAKFATKQELEQAQVGGEVDLSHLATKEELRNIQLTPGRDGDDGAPGQNGESAYEIAKRVNGFSGTEQEWLDSLKGAKGDPGEDGTAGETGGTNPNLFISTNIRLNATNDPKVMWHSQTEFVLSGPYGAYIQLPELNKTSEPLVANDIYTVSFVTNSNAKRVAFYFNNQLSYKLMEEAVIGDSKVYSYTFKAPTDTTLRVHMYIEGNNVQVFKAKLEKGNTSTIVDKFTGMDVRIQSLQYQLQNLESVTKGEHGRILHTAGSSGEMRIEFKQTYINPPTVVATMQDANSRMTYLLEVTNTYFRIKSNYAINNTSVWNYVAYSND